MALVARHRSGQAWRRLVSANYEQELVRRLPSWRTVLPAVLALLALACAIIAAARPINGYAENDATASGRNLIIALDISRSMETADVAPSRLEEARAAAYELIDSLPDDKIGLMVFSGEADLVVPLTYDHTALRDALEQINRGWAGMGGTNFGLVLRRAMQDFSRSAPDGTNALVILSDGEDTVDTSQEVAEEAKEKNLLVITVGIGTETGGAIPDPQGENGLWQDAEGKHVISKLDIKSLSRFAEATGGDFYVMGSGTSLADFAKSAVDKLDRHEETYSASKAPRDLFAWFAGSALLLLVAAIILGTEWRKPRLNAAMLSLGLGLLAFGGQSMAAPDQENVRTYAKALQAKDKEDADQARTLLSQALLDDDASLQAASFFALGNLAAQETFAKLKKLYQADPEAEESGDGSASWPAPSPTPEQLQEVVDELKNDMAHWQDALKADAAHAGSKANISKVEKLIGLLEAEIERLKQQQQQDQQNQQNDNRQDQQDKDDDQSGKQDQQGQGDNQNGEQDRQNQGDDQSSEQNQQNQGDGQNGEQDQQNQGDDRNSEQDQQDKGNDQSGEQDQKDKGDDQNGEQDQQNQGDGQSGEQDQQNQGDGQNGKQDQQNQGDGQNGKQDQQNQGDDQSGEQDQQGQGNKTPDISQERGQNTPQQAKLTDEEKAKQRAIGILQMHLDEEKGSPIPHFNMGARTPKKDY